MHLDRSAKTRRRHRAQDSGRRRLSVCDVGRLRLLGERGSGTVLGVVLVGVALIALAVVSGAGGLAVTKSRALTAADQAALGGAYALRDSSDEARACDVAREVAGRNGATSLECEVQGNDVVVTAHIGGTMDVKASAWAGPVDCSD